VTTAPTAEPVPADRPTLPLPARALVVILRAPHADRFLPVTEVLHAAGLTCFEYTLTTPGALAALAEARAALPEATFGVGTARTGADVEAAAAAGADFVVSQVSLPELVAAATRVGVPFVPGALTPTEIATAWSTGVPAVKVSPIGPVGGVAYLTELRGPLPEVALMPTGGVTLDDAARYLDAGAVAVGVSGALIEDTLTGGDLTELGRRGRRLVASVAG
jgi:2-dehydro-3-deoxyphosphogluconate aldolase/(4S)-4-hydroxy-2-oxoglutarate aldolase